MEKKLRILDYDDVLDELDRITSEGDFQKQESIKTSTGIEIPYYTLGNGENHIVVCGGTHGSEIISVDFVLRLMEELSKKQGTFKDFDLSDYTFHFIPVHNPEGYIISTSCIRTLIGKDASEEEIERISKEYFMAFRSDDIHAKEDPTDKSQKNHQKMFDSVTYECIPLKYEELRKKVKEMYENSEIPRGSMVVHRGNALGIETNRTNLYEALSDETTSRFGPNRYNNINMDIPGPLGVSPSGEDIPENKFLRGLLSRLFNEGKYAGMITYHGTGGMIYSRLSNDDELLVDGELPMDYQEDKYIKSVINKVLTRRYHEDTKYTVNGSQKPGYKIVNDPSLKCMDELLRLEYPGLLLIELSYMGGNPIGPLGDKENNYFPTMEHNLIATKHFFKNCRVLKDVMYGSCYLVDEEVSKEWMEDHTLKK